MAESPSPIVKAKDFTDLQLQDATEDWSNHKALSVVSYNFNQSWQHISRFHGARWDEADKLYALWVKQERWPGTKIPRASMDVPIVFQQINAVIATIIGSIFSRHRYFTLDPKPGTTAEQARNKEELIRDAISRKQLRHTARRVLQSMLLYGNGVARVTLNRSRIHKTVWRDALIPQYKEVNIPGIVQGLRVLEDYKREVRKETLSYWMNNVNVSYVPLREFFPDPTSLSPLIGDESGQGPKWVIERVITQISELRTLREDPLFTDKIPGDDLLLQLAKSGTPASTSNRFRGQTFRSSPIAPIFNASLAPEDQNLEILQYTSDERQIWVINQTEVILNGPNLYRQINYANSFYADVLDNFYAMSLTDVVEPEQKLSRDLLNARLDELALGLHTPRITRRGVSFPKRFRHVFPGANIEADEPKEDVIPMPVSNITQNAFLEAAQSDIRSQKGSGVTDASQLGVASGIGDSMKRTATGSGIIASASGRRMGDILSNLEEYVLVPVIQMADNIIVEFFTPEQVQAYGEPDSLIKKDPITILGAQTTVRIRASNRFRNQSILAQTVPSLTQFLLQPGIIQALQAQGRTVDVNELVELWYEIMDRESTRDLVRDLSKQEQEALAQQQAADQSPGDDRIAADIAKSALSAQTQSESDAAKILNTVLGQALKGASEEGKSEGG